jgi:hypothetical protein
MFMSNDLQVQLEKSAVTLFERANSLQVMDDDTCLKAEQMMVEIKTVSKKWVEFFEPMRKSAEDAKKAIMAKINLMKLDASGDNNAKAAFRALSAKASKYRQEQDRIRREEAEKVRQEQIKQEEAARVAAALKAEKMGDNELAEAIVEEPVYVPPAKPAETPKTKGVSYKELWKHEVINLGVLVKAVAEGKAPLQALQPNDTFLSNQARAMKTESLYPGVRAYPERKPNIRTNR